MFDPNEQIDLHAQSPAAVKPKRPQPKPIADPQTQLWIPADLTVEKPHRTSSKQHVKQLGNFLIPILGISLIVATFAYVATILIGVYQ